MSVNPVARAYNNFRIEPFGLIRKSSTTERLADEIGYYKTVQRDINKAIFFPRIIGSHVGNENWILMERYDYKNLGDYLIGRTDQILNWDTVFNGLTTVLSQFETFGDTQPADPQYIVDMLVDKTQREYQALVDARPDLAELFDSETVTINGTPYKNFKVVWLEDTAKYIASNMLEYAPTMIHGDMCFSNILYGPHAQIFKFIDPRGSFGKKGIYGDVRYDIAKLYHSVDGGYEYIINDDFHVECVESNWELNIPTNPEVLRAFEKKFFETGAFKKKDIKIIQGCIYIGMCARHYDSTKRQEAMYLTGIRLLNEAMKL